MPLTHCGHFNGFAFRVKFRWPPELVSNLSNSNFIFTRDLAERNYHHIDMEQQCLLKLAEKEAKLHPFNIRKCKNYFDVKLKGEGMGCVLVKSFVTLISCIVKG